MILGIATMVIVPIEIISIYLDTKLWTYAPLRLAGLIIAASGTVIFIIAIWAMKESWRAGIPTEDKTEMITQGIYSFSRNPAFLGFDLVYIGILIGFGNVILIVITIFTVIMMHLQILQEEQFLEKVLGKQYRDYKNKVGRYFIFI